MWKSLKLEDVCQIGDGNHSSNYPKASEMVEQGVPFIRAGNIQGGTVSSEDLKFITPEKHLILKKGHLKEGDVLITNRGEIGKTAVVPKIFEGANLNSQIAWLRPDDRLLSQFLFYALSAPEAKASFKSQQSGTALQQLTIRQIKNLHVSYPPLAEQQRIVAKLDAAFAEIDGAIEVANAKEAEIKKLGRHALETFFKENFKTKKIGELGGVKSGGTPKSTEPSYWNGKIEWYSSGELNDMYALSTVKRITNEGLNSSNAKLFPADTLLVGMYDTAAMKMSILQNEATFNQAIVGIPPNEFASPQYLFYALNYLKPKILLERRGVRQQNLSLAKIKNVDVPIPSKEQQQCIVKQANKVTQKIGFIVETLTNKKSQLANLKSAILAQELRSEAA